MKKNNQMKNGDKVRRLNQQLRSVSLVFILLMFSITQLSAESYVQSKKLSIDITDAPLLSLFTEIENKSEFHFFYDNSDVDTSRKVSLTVRNSDIENILDIVFKESDIIAGI